MLAPHREAQLAALGVDWSTERGQHEAHWDACFAELLEFRRTHGHCTVWCPLWSDDPDVPCSLCCSLRLAKLLDVFRLITLRPAAFPELSLSQCDALLQSCCALMHEVTAALRSSSGGKAAWGLGSPGRSSCGALASSPNRASRSSRRSASTLIARRTSPASH